MGSQLSVWPMVLVASGGALGSCLRYLLAVWIPTRTFPTATLLTNVVGSVLIVWVHAAFGKGLVSPELRIFLATGMMGGFTTYSTFNYDLISAVGSGAYGVAVWNFVLTTAGCFFGALLGSFLFRLLP